MAETIISDRAMRVAPGASDRWLIEAGARGAGRLVGRITPTGERRFYYRYTDSRGSRVSNCVQSQVFFSSFHAAAACGQP